MRQSLIAKATVNIDAPKAVVWKALVTPAAIKEYMFGTDMRSDWKVGSPVTFTGVWEGKAYEDKGEILKFEVGEQLQYTHFSPLMGLPDIPENYHTVTIELVEAGPATRVVLTQDGNATDEARDHSERNWGTMLAGLKRYVEK